jgi:hypothetical protein
MVDLLDNGEKTRKGRKWMTTVRALIRKDPVSGRLVGWVPRMMPAARCESDDFVALTEELERIVRAVMEEQQPGAGARGIRIETASVI